MGHGACTYSYCFHVLEALWKRLHSAALIENFAGGHLHHLLLVAL
jgi:hypothetical protein